MAKAIKRPQATLEVLISGEGIFPERLPLRLIGDTLTAVQRLASGLDVDEVKQVPEGDSLGLLGVRRGSAVFQCFAHNPRGAIKNLRLAGRVISSPTRMVTEDIDFVFHPLETLSKAASHMNCAIVVKNASDGETLASFDGNAFESVAKHFLVSGETVIIGRVMRAGGATSEKCALRVKDRRRLLYCDVESRELARILGQHLYDVIAAKGEARWLQRTWKLLSFRVTGVQLTKPTRLLDTMKALHAAGGNAWDAIEDPESVIREFHQ